MKFIFQTSNIDIIEAELQVAQILEHRAKRRSSKKSFLQQDSGSQNSKRKLFSIKSLSIFSLICGLMMLIYSLRSTDELFMLFLLGLLLTTNGISMLFLNNSKKSIFKKGAAALLDGLKDASGAQIVFEESGFLFPDSEIIAYEKIQKIFESEDLIAIIQDGTLILLQKKDLINHHFDDFAKFMKSILAEKWFYVSSRANIRTQ